MPVASDTVVGSSAGDGSPTRPTGDAQRGRGWLRTWIAAHPADVVDLFVYVVVLNLAIEHLPR
ncbi:hypothetical protein [Nocardioides alcanivorans]|uniref:hypothetical protein n=1 Tax=Nocardioides alcanivorans TaxID=2897352 RepID=UPI001F351E49|nr:hypothetical protein [Nocardioides alcanivorans]